MKKSLLKLLTELNKEDSSLKSQLNYSKDKTLKPITSRSTQSLLMKNQEITTISFNGISKIELRERSKTRRSLIQLNHSTCLKMSKMSKKLLLNQITTNLEINNMELPNQSLLNKNMPKLHLKMLENSLEHQLEFLLKTMVSSTH